MNYERVQAALLHNMRVQAASARLSEQAFRQLAGHQGIGKLGEISAALHMLADGAAMNAKASDALADAYLTEENEAAQQVQP